MRRLWGWKLNLSGGSNIKQAYQKFEFSNLVAKVTKIIANSNLYRKEQL